MLWELGPLQGQRGNLAAGVGGARKTWILLRLRPLRQAAIDRRIPVSIREELNSLQDELEGGWRVERTPLPPHFRSCSGCPGKDDVQFLTEGI